VPMADLRTLLTDHVGLTDVTTYIQSGNVVFSGPEATSGRSSGQVDQGSESISQSISAAIADRFGFDVPVVVRESSLLDGLLARSAELFAPGTGNSELDDTHDKRVMVGFLTAAPTADAVAAIDADRSPGDSVIVDGEHAHIQYATGQSSTKLTGDYLERVLGVGMTTRNLSTLRRVAALA